MFHFGCIRNLDFNIESKIKAISVNSCLKYVFGLAVFVKEDYVPTACLDCPFFLFFAQSLSKASFFELHLHLFSLALEHFIR